MLSQHRWCAVEYRIYSFQACLPVNAIVDRFKSWPLYFLPHHFLSRIVFRLTRIESRFVPSAISIFSSLFKVELAEASYPDPGHYKTFNAFFTRTLNKDARPLHDSPEQFCCPVDGRVSQAGAINNGTIIQAKQHHYQLIELLGGREGACKPYSPKTTVLPRVALPFIRPRWLFRCFTLFGIIAIFVVSRIKTLIYPDLNADVALRRLSLRKAVIDFRSQSA